MCSETCSFLLQQHKCNGRLSSETRFILIQLHKFIGHVTSETCFLKLNYTSLMDSRIRKHVSFWFKYISVINSCVRGMVLNMCYNTCTIDLLLYVSSVMSWWLACEWTEIAFVHDFRCVSQRRRFKQIKKTSCVLCVVLSLKVVCVQFRATCSSICSNTLCMLVGLLVATLL